MRSSLTILVPINSINVSIIDRRLHARVRHVHFLPLIGRRPSNPLPAERAHTSIIFTNNSPPAHIIVLSFLSRSRDFHDGKTGIMKPDALPFKRAYVMGFRGFLRTRDSSLSAYIIIQESARTWCKMCLIALIFARFSHGLLFRKP